MLLSRPLPPPLYVCRYHCGSVALGSFIIAIIQMVRVILAYIDRQTKAAQAKNSTLRVVMLAVQCCAWCIEKCIKFIS